MSSFSVDGLVTGLDTTNIIEQLVAVERAPIRRLEQRQSGFNARVGAWNDLEARMTALTEAADSLRENQGLFAVSATATDGVAPTVVGSPAIGSTTFTVDSIARPEMLMSAGFTDATALFGTGSLSVAAGLTGIGVSSYDASSLTSGSYQLVVESVDVDGGTAEVTFDGVAQTVALSGPVTLTAGDASTLDITIDSSLEVGTSTVAHVVSDASTTVADVVSVINATGAGMSARVLDRQDGSATPAVLVLAATRAGSDGGLDLQHSGTTITSPGLVELQAATDTVVSLGGGALDITRSDTVLTELVPGLQIDVGALEVGAEVTVEVVEDTGASTAAVEAFVSSLNDVLSGVRLHGSADPEAGVQGALNGDSSLRRLERVLREPLGQLWDGSIRTLSEVGISVTADGTYEFSEDDFLATFAQGKGDLETFFFGDAGFLDALTTQIDALTATDGLVATSRESAESSIELIADSIESSERRIEAFEARTRAQFVAMETLIAQLNSQGSFLTNGLGG